jgi:hypothetical protein
MSSSLTCNQIQFLTELVQKTKDKLIEIHVPSFQIVNDKLPNKTNQIIFSRYQSEFKLKRYIYWRHHLLTVTWSGEVF